MTLLCNDHVVIVGAGLAGWRTCEELRRHGFEGRITLIGDESEAPYDRPPLSKQVLSGKWPLEHTLLATVEKLEHARVDLRLGVGAQRLDVARTAVTLDDGSVVEGTHIVIATGARARRLSWYEPRHFELRNLADARRLQGRLEELGDGDVVVVIGGGFIGAEVATAMKTRGLRPIVIEAAPRPLLNVLGTSVSQWLSNLAANAGIELRTDQRPSATAYHYDNNDADVIFDDGSTLRARAVVVGVGAQPNVEWLADSGLEIDNGVVVDHHQLCAPRVGAVGDVASFPWNDGSFVRIEHWQVATDHAAALARHWTKGEETGRLIPYFWSDQYGKKIQLLGHPRPDDDVVRVKDSGEGQWLGVYSREGVVSGLIALSQPRALMLSKVLLEYPTTLDEALAVAPWSPTAQA
jgi:3-phenylpropionate/trans-cinnamate dioxygenase ferredoxin reductase subunit